MRPWIRRFCFLQKLPLQGQLNHLFCWGWCWGWCFIHRCIHWRIHWCIHWRIHWCIHWRIHWCIRWCIHWCIHWHMYWYIPWCIHWCIRWFIKKHNLLHLVGPPGRKFHWKHNLRNQGRTQIFTRRLVIPFWYQIQNLRKKLRMLVSRIFSKELSASSCGSSKVNKEFWFECCILLFGY